MYYHVIKNGVVTDVCDNLYDAELKANAINGTVEVCVD